MSTPFETVEITSEQAKKWSDTRAALIWHCPAFSHIFYSMMNKNGSEHIALFSKDCPVAATDGQHVIINPDTFFPLTLNERIFVVAHEISHGIFGHVELMHRLEKQGVVRYPDGKELSYDNETLQHAMDYVINDMLIESKIGSYNPAWLHDKGKGVHTDDVLTVYRRIHKEMTGGKSGAPGQGQGQSGGGNDKGQKPFDKHMAPGTSTGQDPAQAASGRSDVEWKTAIAGAVASARAQGKLPAALDRAMSEVLEPKVDWRDKIIGFFNRKPGGGTYDWRKPDRRLITRDIIAPGRSGYGAGPVVIGIDTSGSIGPKELDMFFGEVYGILDDVRPTHIYLIWCDAAVNRVDEITDTGDLLDVRMKKAPGGGGTAFEPVFDKIAELDIQPDALIYLTDGYGSFPKHAPNYSVLWGAIVPDVKYPFGEVVQIPLTS